MAVKNAQRAAGETADGSVMPLLTDIAVAIKLVSQSSWRKLLRCWVFVPFGVFVMMAACFGVNQLLEIGSVSFPASVACLVLLFVALVLCDIAIGDKKTRKIVKLVNVPGGWSLRWLNIFFTPAFVLLPLSPPISGAEVGKMIAVFVIGFIAMMIFAAYMSRGLQLLMGSRRKAMHQRAEEIKDDGVLTSEPSVDDDGEQTESDTLLDKLSTPPKSHAAAYITIRGQNLDDPLSSFSDVYIPPPVIHYPQALPPRPRAEKWAEFVELHLDTILFASFLAFVAVPVFYTTGYAMPLHLAVNVLAFFGAVSLPASWRQVLHPVIVSAFATLLVIWLFGLTRGEQLPETLAQYKTGNNYIRIWAAGGGGKAGLPGAGDIFSSALDVSIVSLALPMYQYRRELKQHFLAIIIPNVALSVASLFIYPIVCYAIGISAERSLAFTSRSLTLALAQPAVKNLGGDPNTVAAVAIMTGILGVLIGRNMLSWMRIPDDDYVTRGVTFGSNASALGTALLLKIDPRAAALSSLSMSLFGTITVAFSSVPAMVHIIRSLVGLS